MRPVNSSMMTTFAVLDDVVDVALEHHIGLQGLIEVMDDLRVFGIEVAAFQQPRAFQQALALPRHPRSA
jgi:hypothetical protein